MLRTYDGNEATPLSRVFGADIRMWHAVSFEFDTPYFLIVHSQNFGSGKKTDTCLLWGQSNVLDFCNLINKDPDRKIIQFSILSPSSGEQWQMRELKEIWGYPNSEKFRPLIFWGVEGTRLWPESRRGNFTVPSGFQRIYVRQACD